jgi:hypothetical protein
MGLHIPVGQVVAWQLEHMEVMALATFSEIAVVANDGADGNRF